MGVGVGVGVGDTVGLAVGLGEGLGLVVAVGEGEAAVGVTGFDGALGSDSPRAFVAVTENVYCVPFVRPLTVQDIALVVQVAPPGDAVAV